MFQSIRGYFPRSGKKNVAQFPIKSASTTSITSRSASHRSLTSSDPSTGVSNGGSKGGTSNGSSGALDILSIGISSSGQGHASGEPGALEGRRALGNSIRRHTNLARQSTDRLDNNLLNTILSQLWGTDEVDDGMRRVPLHIEGISAKVAEQESRPVAVGLVGGLPTSFVTRSTAVDGASQFGEDTVNGSQADDGTIATFSGFSFAPSLTRNLGMGRNKKAAPPLGVPDTIAEGDEENTSQSNDNNGSHQKIPLPNSKRSLSTAQTSTSSFQSKDLNAGRTDDYRLMSDGKYHKMSNAMSNGFLSRFLLVVLCFVLSLIIAIFLGGGKLGNDAATRMYQNTVTEDSAIGVWLPPSAGGGTMIGLNTPWSPDTADFPPLESMNIVLPPSIEQNFADSTEPFGRGVNRRDDLPVFWQIPRSGSAVVRTIFGRCLQLVQASQLAADRSNDDSLKVYQTTTGVYFVNVDTTTPLGIQRAKLFDLASSGAADVAFTPLINTFAEVPNSLHKARPFALFRHPVEREADFFYHEKANNADWADMTLVEYARSGRMPNNWMTRLLLDKAYSDESLTDEDLYIALEILRRKFVIGLEDKLKASLLRFERYFGWGFTATREMGICQDTVLLDHSVRPTPPSVEVGSEEWYLILGQNNFDLQLYDYAKFLFAIQGGEV